MSGGIGSSFPKGNGEDEILQLPKPNTALHVNNSPYVKTGPTPAICAFETELDEKERAYRRGALQAIQFLQTYLHGKDSSEYLGTIADWREKLLNARDSTNVKYLGTYLDEIRKEVSDAQDSR